MPPAVKGSEFRGARSAGGVGVRVKGWFSVKYAFQGGMAQKTTQKQNVRTDLRNRIEIWFTNGVSDFLCDNLWSKWCRLS